MNRLDYHHIPKVLDLIVVACAHSVLEAHDGEPIYTPLVRAFLPTVKRTDERTAENAHLVRTVYDVVLCHVATGCDAHALLDHVRSLRSKHRGVIVIAQKDEWEKADFAGTGPALFLNDATGIIAYLGKTTDIKAMRRRLLKHRVHRQSSFTPTVEAVFKTVRRVGKIK